MKRTKSTYQEHLDTLSTNEKIAVWVTNRVGTMVCAYIFAGIGIGSIIGVITGNAALGLVCGAVSSYFLQLVLLPIIMVGQNIQNRHAEISAQADFETNIDAEKRIEALQQTIAKMESEKLDKIIDWLGVLLRAEIDRRKRDTETGGQPKRSLRT